MKRTAVIAFSVCLLGVLSGTADLWWWALGNPPYRSTMALGFTSFMMFVGGGFVGAIASES